MPLPRWLSESCVVAATVVRDRREIPMATSDLPRRRPAVANEYSDSDHESAATTSTVLARFRNFKSVWVEWSFFYF
ncbi:hypothetical protein OROMI_016427 [Orobanche minor]